MKSLLVYLKDYKKETVFAPLFKMLEAAFELFVPLVMAAIIDKGIGNSDKPYILKMSLLLVILAVIGLVCAISAQFFAAKAAVGFSARLRKALFHHIQNLSFSEMDMAGTDTLITRMTSDVNQMQSGINMVLRLFLRSPFIVFGAMIMAFTIDVKSALIFAVTIPLLSIVIFGVMLVSIPLYKKVQAKLDTVLGRTRENLTGARVIRAFHKEEDEISAFKKDNQTLTNVQKFVGKISALMNPVTYIMINAGIMVLIRRGALRVEAGAITQGEVVALVNYMSQILVELIKLAGFIITVTKALACAKRIENVFEMHPGEQTVRSEARLFHSIEQENNTVITFEHVGLTYKNAAEASLTDITFSANAGETIGIIGGTGSGKSSLVNLIPRFYDATEGKIYLNGIPIEEYNVESLREKIGFVMQQSVLFKGTVRDNLLWGKEDASEEELNRALEIAQAKQFINEKEGGLNAPILQGGKNLSGGQKQRLTIARALVKEPEILILDDSSSALDFATDLKLRQAIKELTPLPVTFIISQRTASIRHADKIIVMEDGKMAGIGTHDELLQNCDVYQEIYDSQFRKAVN